MATIGLFGTCGDSKWREPFKETYNHQSGIKYFDPVVPNWTPECSKIEAEHLASDDIILFPVTKETYGLGSLGETGFSILYAINMSITRYVVAMIEDLGENLKENMELYKESVKMRALVRAHLAKVQHDNVFIVENLDQMLYVSVVLAKIINQMSVLNEFRPGAKK